jgi:hypothetical protein
MRRFMKWYLRQWERIGLAIIRWYADEDLGTEDTAQ